MIGAFVATCGALVSLLVFVRCPHCRAHLPQIGFAAAVAPATAARQTHCPGCGATLD
jgi:DNA-directed RNA polymerase subunit RPC12/RpoP